MRVTVSVLGRFHAFYLAQQLLKRNALCSLLTSYPRFEVVKYGIPLEKIVSMPFFELLSRSWYKLPRFIRDVYDMKYTCSELYDRRASHKLDNADIITGWSFSFLLTLREAKSKGMITIVERGSSHIIHQMNILREEYERHGIEQKLAHPALIEKELLEYEEADYISIPSYFVKRTFLEQGIPEKKLIHVPYGVHIDEFKQTAKEDDIFRIIYVGSMTLQKGVHYLLQAFFELYLPNSELWLVGSMSSEMAFFLKKFDNGKVFYKGHQSQKVLYKYYSQSSVFIINSIQDGFGMVIPQAMACGLPVICTTNTGGEDIVRDGKDGFIIPIRDVEAVKDKILYFYENSEICKAMGHSAKERVGSGFTWDDYGDKMIEAYKQCIKNREKNQ